MSIIKNAKVKFGQHFTWGQVCRFNYLNPHVLHVHLYVHNLAACEPICLE